MSAATAQIAAGMPNGVGEDAGEEGADGEAAVAPEPVDADRAGPPGGVGDVADRGEQGRVDHRGAGAEQRPRRAPTARSRWSAAIQRDGDGLGEHAAGDEPLAADPVGQRAGDELAEAPHGGVERGEDADAADGQAGGGEEDREQAPGEAVVEVVDQAGLAGTTTAPCSRKLVSAKTSPVVSSPWWVAVGGDVVGGLVAGVAAGLAHEERRQAEAEAGVGERRGRTARGAARRAAAM